MSTRLPIVSRPAGSHRGCVVERQNLRLPFSFEPSVAKSDDQTSWRHGGMARMRRALVADARDEKPVEQSKQSKAKVERATGNAGEESLIQNSKDVQQARGSTQQRMVPGTHKEQKSNEETRAAPLETFLEEARKEDVSPDRFEMGPGLRRSSEPSSGRRTSRPPWNDPGQMHDGRAPQQPPGSTPGVR